MTDTIILMHASDLPSLAEEAHQHELLRTLSGLETNNGKNYAIYNDPEFTPAGKLVILPFPSVGPNNSEKICDGTFTISGNQLKVSAYRV